MNIENMKIENIRKVISVIQAEQGYNLCMSSYTTVSTTTLNKGGEPKWGVCGTAHCIAGHAKVISSKEDPDINHFYPHPSQSPVVASEWLGLDECTSNELFNMSSGPPEALREFDSLRPSVRAAIAIWVLENLIETGTVDWATAARIHGAYVFASIYARYDVDRWRYLQ